MIILDSNVVSELMMAESARVVITWLDGQAWTALWTTAVTVLEIRAGLAVMPSGRRRSNLESAFDRLLEQYFDDRVLPFDRAAAEQAAGLAALRHRAGRQGELGDTMIAGIALVQRATLATRNVRHFDDLDIAVVDPWRP